MGVIKIFYATGTLYGNRTRVSALRGQCPRPLDEESLKKLSISINLYLLNLKEILFFIFILHCTADI